MAYQKNDRSGWGQSAPSDNNELRDLKRKFNCHRIKLILIGIAATIAYIAFFLFILHQGDKSLGRTIIYGLTLVAYCFFMIWLFVLNAKGYQELIIDYLLKEYKGDLQKENKHAGLTINTMRRARLWGTLEDRKMSLLHRAYSHSVEDEDNFSSKEHPFQFFEVTLLLTKGYGRYQSEKRLFHGPVVKVKLPSVTDGIIVKTSTSLKKNRVEVDNDAPEIKALNLNSLWDEICAVSQNRIQNPPFAIVIDADSMFIFFENKHNLFDPSFWKGATDKRIAEDANYIRAMYEIGTLVCENIKA